MDKNEKHLSDIKGIVDRMMIIFKKTEDSVEAVVEETAGMSAMVDTILSHKQFKKVTHL